MSDISKIVAGTRALQILHPKTKEPIGLVVTLASKDDEDVNDAERKWRENQQTMAMMGKAADDEPLAKVKVVAAVKKWEWIGDTTFEGKKLEATKPNVRMVFNRLPYVYEQCLTAFVEYGAFFGD